jgi:hypothetical protein
MGSDGHECGSSDLTEGNGCLDILRIKRILYGHFIWFIGLNDFLKTRFDFVDFVMEGFLAGGFDYTGAENGIRVFRVFNDAEPCGLYAGIDSKDPHQFIYEEYLAISSSSISKFAQTF